MTTTSQSKTTPMNQRLVANKTQAEHSKRYLTIVHHYSDVGIRPEREGEEDGRWLVEYTELVPGDDHYDDEPNWNWTR